MVQWIENIKPDIIHLHNIHGDWINLKILFSYIKEKKIPVVWTLHDCWSFTGRCSHFEVNDCKKWKTGCYKCKNKKVYPITYFFDFSKKLWKEKKELFNELNCHIVVPSKWLGQYVKDSFLGQYPIYVIHNGIDTNIYHHIDDKCEYIDKNQKKIILGVANSWSKRKGFEDFIKLAKKLDSNIYQIVMVGLNDEQMKKIPKNIIGIKRTTNQYELVKLYSSADIFVNPTYQDNYPTTNLEAVACGTLAITYNTGGSPESMISQDCILEKGDITGLYNMIVSVCNNKPYTHKFLQNYAKNKFDKTIVFQEYIKVYKKIMEGEKNECSNSTFCI